MNELLFSIKDALGMGWSKFLKRKRFLLLISFTYLFVGISLSYLAGMVQIQYSERLGFLIHVFAQLILAWLFVGVVKIVLSVLDDGDTHFSDLFKNVRLLWAYLVAYLLFGLAVFAGLLLLLVPGIVFGIKFSFFPYYVVDKKLSSVEALRASSRLTQGAKARLLEFYFLLFLINFAGILPLAVGVWLIDPQAAIVHPYLWIFGAGTLITFPVTFLAHAYVYRKLCKIQSEEIVDIEIQQIAILKKDLWNDERMQFDIQFASRRRNPTTAFILSFFLGALGIDRFYLGHIALGIGKLLTLGGLGLWAFIDLFLILGAARRRNIELAQQIASTIYQMRR